MLRHCFAAAVLCVLLGSLASAGTWIPGYWRSNGTYVAGHWRSAPDGNFWNNWSTYPNVNPYTGRVGTRRWPAYQYQYRYYRPYVPTVPTYQPYFHYQYRYGW